MDRLLSVPEYLVDFSTRPINIYPWFVRIILSYLILILLAMNAPALLVKGDIRFFQMGIILIFNFILTIVSINLWKKGLRKYVSSN